MNILPVGMACLMATLCAGAAELRVADYAPSNTFPTFDHGYLVVYELESSLRVHGPDGSLVYRFRPAKGYPNSAALRADGTGAAAVGHWTDDGSGAIVCLDRSGTVTKVIETSGFIPVDLSFAEDGSLWVLGARASASEADYHLLRHYSKDGPELGRYVKRSSIGGSGEPVVDHTGGWVIRTSQNRVGIHLFNSDPRLWIETTFDGVEQGRWVVDFDGYPAAFTRSGDVFGRSIAGPVKLDRQTGKWQSISLAEDGRLAGAEADDLVLLDPTGTVHRIKDPSF